MLIPRKEQAAAIAQVLADKAHLSKAAVGSGKTLVGVEAVLQAGTEVNLVIGPLSTESGWRRTFETQSQGKARFVQIDGKAKGKQAFQDITDGVPGVYFIGWERFRMLSWNKVPLDFVIADETHRQANRRSKIALMANTTAKTPYKLALSATPASNKIEGIWQTYHWLWPDTFKHYWPFVSQYMVTELDPYQGKKIMGEKNPGAVWDAALSKSSFPSPFQQQPIVHTIEVDMTPAQRKIYDRFEKESVAWLDQFPLIAELPAVQAMRLRQITLAVPSIRFDTVTKRDKDTGLEETEVKEVVYFEDDAKSSKIDAVFDVLADLYAEKPQPVVMYTHSRKFAQILTLRLQAKGYNARQYIGGMSADERKWKLDNFGVEYDIMVATISAVGTGTDGMQRVCSIEFWLSLEDNRVLNRQCVGRLSRDGQTETVQRYLFRAKDTIELKQLARIAHDDALLDESLGEEVKEAA